MVPTSVVQQACQHIKDLPLQQACTNNRPLLNKEQRLSIPKAVSTDLRLLTLDRPVEITFIYRHGATIKYFHSVDLSNLESLTLQHDFLSKLGSVQVL